IAGTARRELQFSSGVFERRRSWCSAAFLPRGAILVLGMLRTPDPVRDLGFSLWALLARRRPSAKARRPRQIQIHAGIKAATPGEMPQLCPNLDESDDARIRPSARVPWVGHLRRSCMSVRVRRAEHSHEEQP